MKNGKDTKTKRPTIADVAKLAGVAPAIVSRALSPSKRPVSEDKKKRVLEAAKALGYTRNPLARGLATNSLDLVAIIVNQMNDLSDLDLFDPLLDSIQQLGKQATIIRVGKTDGIEQFLQTSISYHVDSAVVFSDFTDGAGARELFRTENVLMLNGRSDDMSSSIQINDMAGISEAVASAQSQQVKRVGFVTGRVSSLLEQERCSKFRAAFADAGLDVVHESQGNYSYQSGFDASEQLDQDALPDAIFCTSDAMAMGVMDGLRKQGISAPDDYLLYGFDVVRRANFEAYDISSIGFKKAEMIAMISSFVADPKAFNQVGQIQTIDTRFVQRSTG